MPKIKCCVPQCPTSNYKNKTERVRFHRIPLEKKLREQYWSILGNKISDSKFNSKCSRLCAKHWEGGEKLSRNHLPTIFSWTVPEEIVQQNEFLKSESIKMALQIYSKTNVCHPKSGDWPRKTFCHDGIHQFVKRPADEEFVFHERQRERKADKTENNVHTSCLNLSPNEPETISELKMSCQLFNVQQEPSIDIIDQKEQFKVERINPVETKNIRLEKVISRLKRQQCNDK